MEIYNRVINDLEKEVKRLRLSNIRMRLHMEVLISHPNIKAAAKIREKYSRVQPVPEEN